MRDYFKENVQLYAILFVWSAIGIFAGSLDYIIIPITIMLMKQKGMYEELLIGFFFILILSDSLLPFLAFAKNVKIIYLVMLAAFLIFDYDEFRPFNNFYKYFAPFFLIAIICMFFSPSLFVSFQKTTSYIIMFIMIPNFMSKFYRDNGLKSFKNIIYFCTTILIAGFVLYFVKKEYAFNPIIKRYNGLFGNPNGVGAFAFFVFVLFWSLNDIYEEIFSKREKILIYSVVVFSIIFSGSRNAFISVVILILFDRFFRKSSFWGLIMSIILFMGYFLFAVYIPVLIKQFGLDSFFRLNTLKELGGRAVAWEFAWGKIQNNYFIGKGFGYDEITMRANYHMLGKLGTQGGVHSSYLSLWMNFGLIGLLIYMRSFFLVFIKAIKINRLAFSVMYAVLFSAAFEGLFIGSLNPEMIIILMIISLICDPTFTSKELVKQELTLA